MAAERDEQAKALELDASEVALVIGEEDSAMSVRVVAAKELPEDGADIPPASEIVLALAMRLLKDPGFHDEVLDWYYEHQDDEDEEEDEAEE
jgi:hypothetical protein